MRVCGVCEWREVTEPLNAPTINRTHVRTHIRTHALTHAHEHAEGWRPGKGADTVRGPGLSHPQVAGTRLGREVPGEWSTLRTSRRTGSSPPPPAAPGSLHGFRLAAGPIRAAQRSPRGPRRGPGASRPCRPWRPRGRPPAGAGHIWAGHSSAHSRGLDADRGGPGLDRGFRWIRSTSGALRLLPIYVASRMRIQTANIENINQL